MKRIGLVSILFIFSLFANSQEPEAVDVLGLSLEDLLNLKVSVSTKQSTGIRETPGIITVITEEEIQQSGARDIIDLFQLLVPGFGFGVDVEGVVGIGVRGLWAHEGKVLFMVDDQEINEGMFGTVQLGNHFSLENINRIEIIRGPGSAVYGGFASVAVVNIITRKGNGTGGYASYLVSSTGKSTLHNNLSFGAYTDKNDLKFSLSGVYGKGSRSERNYVDYYGTERSLKGNSELNPTSINLQFAYKGFEFLNIIDDYKTTQIDLWDEAYTGIALDERFFGNFTQAKYTIKVSEKFTVVPKFNYKRQKPWNLNLTDDYFAYTNNKEFSRFSGGVMASYNQNDRVSISTGVEYSDDRLHMPEFVHQYEETFANGTNTLAYSNFAAYIQGNLNTKFLNVNLGARYDLSSEFGDAFVPRIGITKAFEKLHFKLMASQSFRVPGGIIPNRIPLGIDGVTPERGTNFEFELGYKLPYNFWVVLNGFDISFKDVIVYGATPSGVGTYKNEGKIGTQGLEGEVKHLSEKWSANLNVSYYRVSKKRTDNAFIVTESENLFLGFSPVRVNSLVSFKPTRTITVTPSLLYFGKRYAYTCYDSTLDEDILSSFDPIIIANLNFRLKDFLVKNFTFDIGLHNILAANFVYLQPYQGAHGPLPGLDRSLKVKASYQF